MFTTTMLFDVAYTAYSSQGKDGRILKRFEEIFIRMSGVDQLIQIDEFAVIWHLLVS